jgi:hypothetical protein
LIESIFSTLLNKKHLTNEDFDFIVNDFKNIKGLGLSTQSKLIYFLELKFNNNHCLILDQRLINVFGSSIYSEFNSLSNIRYKNSENQYLAIKNDISSIIKTHAENIELFLFTFGLNLKV